MIPLLLLAACSLLPFAAGFYLPGLAPKNYLVGDPVSLQVNALVPSQFNNSKAKAIVPYEYYNKNFQFCKPLGKEPKQIIGSLGSVLFGDRIYESPFELHILKDLKCKRLCLSEINQKSSSFISRRIQENYKMDWLIDGLPAAQLQQDPDRDRILDIGFPLGIPEVGPEKLPSINNHYDIQINYHTVDSIHYRVVGVYVSPKSINTKPDDSEEIACSSTDPMIIYPNQQNSIVYTFSVTWK
ncbi:hypothetical protein BB560_003859, partial [Smittium megazygosporum]